jgi:hypothetical protein
VRGGRALLTQQVLDIASVIEPEALFEGIEQLDHGERLFGRPVERQHGELIPVLSNVNQHVRRTK